MTDELTNLTRGFATRCLGLFACGLMLASAGCISSDSLGFAAAITVTADGSITDNVLQEVQVLSIHANGDENETYELPLGRALNRVERVVYVPLSSTVSIGFELEALGANGVVLASGESGTVTMRSGHTSYVDISLSAHAADLGVDDAGGNVDEGDGGTEVTLDGETIALPAGWQAYILRDFSSGTGYTYNPQQYTDGDATDDNHPRRINTLVAPFHDGIAILVGRQILELSSTGQSILHDYTPTMPNAGNYPDIPADMFFERAASSNTGHLLIGGNSPGAGDGVFQVNTAWVMTPLVMSNSTACVMGDPTGLFDAQTGPQTYYCVSSVDPGQGTFYRQGDMAEIAAYETNTMELVDAEVGSAQTLSVVGYGGVVPTGEFRLGQVTAAGGTYSTRVFSSVSTSSATLVTGELTRLPSGIHALIGGTQLVVLDSDVDTTSVLAQTVTPNWIWQAAVVPQASYSLGGVPAYFVLESNRMLNKDRILVLTPP